MTRLSIWASATLLVVMLLGAILVLGRSQGRVGCEAAAAKAAGEEALQASRALDRVHAEVDRLRDRASRTRSDAKRAADQVRGDAECGSVPGSFRGLFPDPDRGPPAAAAGVARGALPAVAEPGR